MGLKDKLGVFMEAVIRTLFAEGIANEIGDDRCVLPPHKRDVVIVYVWTQAGDRMSHNETIWSMSSENFRLKEAHWQRGMMYDKAVVDRLMAEAEAEWQKLNSNPERRLIQRWITYFLHRD